MICEHCLDSEATVLISRKIGGCTQTLGLCERCANRIGFHSPLDESPFPLGQLLARLFGNPGGLDSADDFSQSSSAPASAETPDFSDAIPELVCPDCHLTYSEFIRRGRLGCGQCYREFRGRLENIMLKIHGASQHVGNVPQISYDGMSAVQTEERLQRELAEAVEREDYEKAAELRDLIQNLDKSDDVVATATAGN